MKIKPRKNCYPIFVSYDYPPLEGGISRLCVEVVNFLKEKNDAVSVITAWQKNSNVYFCAPDVFTIRVSCKRIFRELLTYWYLLFRFVGKKHNLIITGVWYPEALLCVLSGFKNLIIFAHGNEVMPSVKGFKGSIQRRLRKFVFKRAKLVIANSHYTANLVRVIAPKGNIVTIPLGVDPVKFSPFVDKCFLRKQRGIPENKIVILTVARVQAYKGHDVVLKALSMLSNVEKSAFLYLVIGRGDYLEELKSIAKNLNVEDVVQWLGSISEEDLPDYYRLSDLFVLCTREEKSLQEVEGFGLVFLEAQASGLMVIGTNQGGVPDAIDHGNGGFLINRDDCFQLTNYLKSFIQNSVILVEQGKLARKRVEDGCTWMHFRKSFYNTLSENLLDGSL